MALVCASAVVTVALYPDNTAVPDCTKTPTGNSAHAHH